MTHIDLDAALDRYSNAATPGRLAVLDDVVFARIDAESVVDARLPLRVTTLAAIGALCIGMTSVMVTPVQPPSAPTLGTVGDLAPSTLLAGLAR